MGNRSHEAIYRQRKRRRGAGLVLFLLANVYLLFSFVFGERGVLTFARTRGAHDALLENTALLQEENARLQAQIADLQNSPFYIERLARERLGMVRDNEWVYEFYEKE